MSKQFPAGRKDNLTGRALVNLTAKTLTIITTDGEIVLARYGARYIVSWLGVVWSSHTTLVEAEHEIADMTRRAALAA